MRRDLDAGHHVARRRTPGTGSAPAATVVVGSGRRRRWAAATTLRRRRAVGRRWSSSSSPAPRPSEPLELVVEAVLGLGVLEPGAPQLVGDEPEHQQAGGDEDLAERADDPAPVVRRRRSVPPRDGRRAAGSRSRWRSGRGLRRVARHAGAAASASAHRHGSRTVPVASPGDGSPGTASSSWTTPSPCSARFPALAGVDLARRASARSSCCAVPTAPARRRCCGSAPVCCRWPAAAAPCSAATSPPTAPRCAGRVGLLGHRNGLYLDLTVTENVRFWGATVGRHATTRSPPRWTASASPAGSPTLPGAPPVGRPAAAHRAGLPRRPPGPAVAARRAPRRPRRRRARRARRHAAPGRGVRAPRSIVASHELERAGSLATRCVDVVAGQVDVRRRAPVTVLRRVVRDLAHGCSSPARTCASSGAAASRSTRSCRSRRS